MTLGRNFTKTGSVDMGFQTSQNLYLLTGMEAIIRDFQSCDQIFKTQIS